MPGWAHFKHLKCHSGKLYQIMLIITKCSEVISKIGNCANYVKHNILGWFALGSVPLVDLVQINGAISRRNPFLVNYPSYSDFVFVHLFVAAIS